MIRWLWLIPAAMFGAAVGILVHALCVAGKEN